LENRIRQHRETKGLTQKELAEKVGMDRTYLNQIEQGKRKASLMMLERIAKALDVSVKDLF
jgi:transcriptional regulator with XRE-family HTH domain